MNYVGEFKTIISYLYIFSTNVNRAVIIFPNTYKNWNWLILQSNWDDTCTLTLYLANPLIRILFVSSFFSLTFFVMIWIEGIHLWFSRKSIFKFIIARILACLLYFLYRTSEKNIHFWCNSHYHNMIFWLNRIERRLTLLKNGSIKMTKIRILIKRVHTKNNKIKENGCNA